MDMTPEEIEAFEWSYCISRCDVIDAPPIQFFSRVIHAKEVLKQLQTEYPDIPFGIFARGDRLYIPMAPEIHEFLH